VIDTQHDVGPVGSSSLDISVRTALAVAEHHLALGDVVGLAERGGARRVLPGSAGRLQLTRVREWLIDLRSAAPTRSGAITNLAQRPSSRTFVIAFSPLLDEGSVIELASARRRGSPVFVVDVLSHEALPPSGDETGDVARRLWLLEREMYLDQLGDLGVPIVRWSAGFELDAVLSDMTRLAAAPRMRLG